MIRKNIFFALFSLFFLSLSACNHLKKSCTEVNWYEVGRQDSTRGKKWSVVFSERQGICSIKKESSYAEAYKNGFDAGLREYCSFKTGYIYGLSNSKERTKASCPKPLKEIFAKGYEAGSYMQEIQSLQSQIKKKVNGLEEKIKKYEIEKEIAHN